MYRFIKYLIIIALLTKVIFAMQNRYFAVMSPTDYTAIAETGWNVSEPIWKPDSMAVMFDKQGNVRFTDDERAVLDSLDALLIPVSEVKNWLVENGWIEEGE